MIRTGGEQGEWECKVTPNEYGILFWSDGNVLKLTGDVCTSLWIY